MFTAQISKFKLVSILFIATFMLVGISCKGGGDGSSGFGAASCDFQPTGFTFCEDYTNVYTQVLPNLKAVCDVPGTNVWSTTLCDPFGAVGKCTITNVYTSVKFEYDPLNGVAANATCVFLGGVWTAFP